jgi:non-heme chloroperoxidase
MAFALPRLPIGPNFLQRSGERAVLRLQPPRGEGFAGLVDWFWMQGMLAGHKNTYDCIKAISETDFTEDLKKFDIPTLMVHGDDDQIVPIDVAGRASAKLVRDATLKVYACAPHGLTDTHKDQLNADLLAFCQSSRSRSQAQK